MTDANEGGALHRLLLGVSSSPLRRWGLGAALWIIFFLVVAWFFAPAALPFVRGTGAITDSTLAAIAPIGTDRDAFVKNIERATDAERRQIAKLSFVSKPFPVVLPAQYLPIPTDGSFGSASPSDRDLFRDFAKIYQAAGCAPGGTPDIAALKAADDKLSKMNNAMGFAFARVQYHHALVYMCEGQFGDAAARWQSALDQIKNLSADDRGRASVRQYAFLSTAGLMMAGPRAGQDPAKLPTDLPAETGFGGASCTAARVTDGCPLVDWSERQTTLVRLDHLMTSRSGDQRAYTALLNNLLANAGDLDTAALANLAAAAAMFGDYPTLSRLYATWSNDTSPAGPTCEAGARLANLVWLSGVADGAEIPVDKYCGEAASLPTGQGARGDDMETLAAWGPLNRDRAALKQGRFADLITEINGSSDAQPDAQQFLEDARREILARLGSSLLERAESLTSSNGAATRRSILGMLQNPLFDRGTRIQAALDDHWGKPFRPTIWWCIFWLAVAGLLLWTIWLALTGYSQLFTRRHFVDRRRKSALGR